MILFISVNEATIQSQNNVINQNKLIKINPRATVPEHGTVRASSWSYQDGDDNIGVDHLNERDLVILRETISCADLKIHQVHLRSLFNLLLSFSLLFSQIKCGQKIMYTFPIVQWVI